MASTDVEICNNGLADAGLTITIGSLTDDDTAGRLSGRFYQSVLEGLLGAFPWSFARRVEELALSSEDPTTNWDYRYVEPADCVKIREIMHDPDLVVPPPYDREQNIAGNAVTILTNTPEAFLIYTRQVEYPAMFSTGFTVAFQYAMAAKYALGIKENVKLAQELGRLSRASLADAMADDRGEVNVTRRNIPDWQDNR